MIVPAPRAKRAKDLRRSSKKKREIERFLYPEVVERPKTRGECVDVPRPCPFIGCRHNLFLEVTHAGSIVYFYENKEPGDVPAHQSCALDLAERGGMQLEEIGAVFGTTRERARQIEESALVKLRKRTRTEDYG